MNKQINLIKKFDSWDILILLDACRADKFELYKGLILNTILDRKINYQRVSTNGVTFTRQWLYKTWGDKMYSNINYISANGFVNTKGITVLEDKYSFDGKNHFGRIHDVWDYGYNYKTGRVAPWTMTFYSLKLIDRAMNNILHYQQPHAPYIFPDGSSGGFRNIDKIRYASKEDRFNKYISKQVQRKMRTIPNLISNTFDYTVPHTLKWSLSDAIPYLNKIFTHSRRKYHQMWKMHGRKEIEKAYELNLISALAHLFPLLKTFSDCNILITADHGERLGEYGQYGHGGIPTKILTTVPFMLIKAQEKKLNEQDKIKNIVSRSKLI